MNVLQEEQAQKTRTMKNIIDRFVEENFEPTEEWSEIYKMWLPIEVKRRLEGRLHNLFEY